MTVIARLAIAPAVELCPRLGRDFRDLPDELSDAVQPNIVLVETYPPISNSTCPKFARESPDSHFAVHFPVQPQEKVQQFHQAGLSILHPTKFH